MRKKAVPVGIEDFERIINEDYYYVDKTLLIEELLINRAPVTLFTRPRRFGKTLNMSMIKYFFDVKNKEENKKLFENLKISNSEYMSEQGKYPVIFISLKDLKEDTWEECIESIKDIMHKIFNEYSFLREKLNVVEKRQFDKIWEITGNERNFKTSLLDLSNYLNKYYGEKAIILIDEYDAPIINAFDKGYYNEAVNFFQTFYSSALKTNNSLKYGILTGITRIIKEGIFSGLNNLYVNTILSRDYSEYFGLLESEVVEILDYFNMKYKIEEVKEWYNGYIFGEREVIFPIFLSYIPKTYILLLLFKFFSRFNKKEVISISGKTSPFFSSVSFSVLGIVISINSYFLFTGKILTVVVKKTVFFFSLSSLHKFRQKVVFPLDPTAVTISFFRKFSNFSRVSTFFKNISPPFSFSIYYLISDVFIVFISFYKLTVSFFSYKFIIFYNYFSSYNSHYRVSL